MNDPQPDFAALEAAALDLARIAGNEIVSAMAGVLTVEYKTESKRADAAPTDPVSQIDRAVEARLRERIARDFPGHAVIGEEVDEQPEAGAETIWIVDPVDGTTNFVNRFPLFACSIGVVHRGVPVAAALWTSTGHALTPGVYHAHRGGGLWFEGEPIAVPPEDTGVRRRLSAAPGGAAGRTATWDNRVTGCAAIECAFVAAGIFASAQFWGPRIWDVAAGVLLVKEAGRELLTRDGKEWVPFERFEAPATVKADREPTLRDWVRPLLMGTPDAVTVLRQQKARRRGLVSRVLRR